MRASRQVIIMEIPLRIPAVVTRPFRNGLESRLRGDDTRSDVPESKRNGIQGAGIRAIHGCGIRASRPRHRPVR